MEYNIFSLHRVHKVLLFVEDLPFFREEFSIVD